MKARAPSETSTQRPQRRPFASAGMIRFLAAACLFIGGAATVGAVGYAINGATQAQADIVVEVKARPETVGEGGALRLTAAGTPAGTSLEAPPDALRLRAPDSTVREQVLNRSGIAVLGLCVGVGAVLLRRLLLSVADGRPFEPGNAARVAAIAALVVVASLASDFLPVFGTNLVLEPLMVAPLLLALAEAFRRGTELAHDADGLV